jgi:hypothetical protein
MLELRNPWQEYLKRAFCNWYNYGVLGLMGGLALIFQNEAPLYLALAGELVYLYMLISNPRYIRMIDAEISKENELNVVELRNRLWPYIDETYRARYLQLEQKANRLDDEDVSALRKRDPYYQQNLHKIAILLGSFLRIAVAVTRYNTYLRDINAEEIKANITRLEEEAKTADQRIQEVKTKNIEILTKRIEKLEKAKANSGYLQAQMDTIEDTMSLTIDQAITLTDPKGMGVQIDNLLANLQETELITSEMESFDELEAGLTGGEQREQD